MLGRYAWISLAALSTLRHLPTVGWMAEAIHAVRGLARALMPGRYAWISLRRYPPYAACQP